jgi:hypothetical protein
VPRRRCSTTPPEQFLRADVLEQKTTRPGPQRGERVPVRVERRQHEDPQTPTGGDDAPGGLDPVDAGHTDVHQHHIGSQLADPTNGAVLGLADNLGVGGGERSKTTIGAAPRPVGRGHGFVGGQCRECRALSAVVLGLSADAQVSWLHRLFADATPTVDELALE